MDFKGQQLAETLAMYIVIVAAVLSFFLGYLRQDFDAMIHLFGGGVVLAAVVSLPDWPVYNKHPVAWLPPKEKPGDKKGSGSAVPKSKKKAASWSNLWGAL